jgi:hypothetical protein
VPDSRERRLFAAALCRHTGENHRPASKIWTRTAQPSISIAQQGDCI